MLGTEIGRLTEEDLGRLRMATVKKWAPAEHPSVYSKEEKEAGMLAYYHLMGELVKRYEIDDTRGWEASPFSGLIYYTDG